MTTTDLPVEPTIDIADVVARFGDLPTLAPVAVEVLRLADDERAGLDDIAEVISRDPGLASQLLRLANSSMYSTGREVTSLSRAAAVLGLRTVKLLSLSFSLVASVGEEEVVVWRRSLAGSALARSLAEVKDAQIADECFVAGLLGHLGKLALAGENTHRELTEVEGGWAGSASETRVLGFASEQVTRRILDGWSLPPLFGEAIEHRGDPDTVDGPAGRIARILHVADAAAWLLTCHDDHEVAALEACTTGAARYLDVDEDELEVLLVESAPAVGEIAAMFDMNVLGDTPVTELLMRAKESLQRVSLDVAAALSEEQQRSTMLQSENERLASEAATDPLTQLPNRRALDGYLENQIGGRMRNPRDGLLGLMIFDIDKFKSVNDTFGHQVGDEILQGLAERLKAITRRGELVTRLGGEEFAVVLPTTDENEIAKAAERFRAAVDAEPFDTAMGPLEVTVSVGTACVAECATETAERLYETADKALYAAKDAGRNRVVVGGVI